MPDAIPKGAATAGLEGDAERDYYPDQTKAHKLQKDQMDF